MNTYSEQIIKAYNNWMAKVEVEPRDEWHEKYKSSRRNSKRAGDKFESLCKAEGFNYIEVASDLVPHIIKIS